MVLNVDAINAKYHFSGGSRRRTRFAPPKSPDSFVLTYKFYKMYPCLAVGAPYEIGAR